MGAGLSSLSPEEEAIVKLLTQLLKERGVKNEPFKIKLLLKFLRKQGFPSMASTVFDVKTWDQAGKILWEAASRGDTDAAEVITTWWLVTETLRSWQAEKTVRSTAAQAVTAAKPRSEPARSPGRCKLIDLGDDKEGGRRPLLNPSAPALPTPGNAFQWDLIKELRKAVSTHGLRAPFTQSLLEYVMAGQLLVPYDCRQIAALILTPKHKLLWEQTWEAGCRLAALGNMQRQPGDPLRGAGVPQLMGTGPFLDPRLQARLNAAILRQAASLALQAMLKLPGAGEAEPPFTSVRQRLTEPYMRFIGRLRGALDRQIDNREAKEVLTLKLAVENANADCKKILRALPANSTLVQMIKACSPAGSIDHHAAALAAAFAAALKSGGKRCFHCRATGHCATQCPQRGAGGERGNPAPPTICPRCGKGWHWARQCRWKHNAEGQPAQPRRGHGKRSAGQGRTMTPVTGLSSRKSLGQAVMTTGPQPQPPPAPVSPWVPSQPKPKKAPHGMALQ
uniref:CCHC-type domain-containing protein n=1 Tax=Anas zonorhyncha TaxID=75864 RepID=A0A8B9U473_9AVES